MRKFVPIFLLVPIIASGWIAAGQYGSPANLLQRIEGHFDDRPERKILILGNSRTYIHHMPQMLRSIADSAGSPEKYRITLWAPPGSSLESLWKDGHTQELLAQTWDDAIVQAESRGQSNEKLEKSFMTYGAKLLDGIGLESGKPRLVQNWEYDPALFDKDIEGRVRAYYMHKMAKDHRILAERTRTHLIQVGRLWEEMRRKYSDISFTQDGNHPSIAGSYLYALLLYADLSGKDISNVTFVPEGISAQIAGILKAAANSFADCTRSPLRTC